MIMRADLSQSVNQSDKLIVKNQLTGSNNSLSVDIQKVGNNNSGLNVDLITAPKGSNKEIFKVANSRLGWYKRSGMNVVNFIISKDLLENRIKDGAGLLNPLSYYLVKVGI